MKRLALALVLAALAAVLPAAPSGAGVVTTDVYYSRFLAVDRDGRTHEIEAVVDDRPSGALLVLTLRRQCGSCRADVYAKKLTFEEFDVRYDSARAECVCFIASVETKFAGAPLRIEWLWDPEQGGAPAGDGYRWDAVTANNLVNVGCFGEGTVTSSPNLLSGEDAPKPKGARKFPKKTPRDFVPEWPRIPGCHTESP